MSFASPQRPRWLRRLQDSLLLPIALVVIVLEDVLWRGARVVLRQLNGLPAIAALRTQLGRLPGWAALPLFLLPELAGRLGDIWFALLLYRGHLVRAVLAYAAVRALATLLAVFIWQACSVALLQMRWFAAVVGWIERVRDWALASTAVLRAKVRLLRWRGRAGATHRVRVLRRGLLGWFRRAPR